MFWRNNFTYNDTHVDYLKNKGKTNYTYAESSSYRIVPEKENCSEPYLMRNYIHKSILDSELYESNVQASNEMTLKRSSNKVTTSETSTPNRKKTQLGDSDRVLRSRFHITSQVNNNTNIPFVRECSDNEIYKFSLLNTNTNNSGPDDNKKQSNLCNYDISGDEGMGSDVVNSGNTTGKFGSNNANSIRPVIQHQDKTKNKWFQKNMFGLPNDESDEGNQDLSGAISGDEQYDIASYRQSNLNHRSKWSKLQTRKSHTSDVSNVNRKLDNICCSPGAMISFLVEWIIQIIATFVSQVVRHTRRITHHSTLIRWLMVPFYLPKIFIVNTVAAFAYSSDRLFGTSIRHRLNLYNRSRNSLFTNVFIIFWLLFVVTAIIILSYLFLVDRTTSSDVHSSFEYNLNLFQHFNRIFDNDCMKKNGCCFTNWELTRRFAFCLFSLPARMVISDSNKVSSNFDTLESPKLTKNISNLKEILEKFEEQLKNQDQTLVIYNKKISELETNFLSKSSSYQLTENRILEMTSKVKNLQLELEQLKLANFKAEEAIVHLTKNQNNNLNSMYSSLEKSKQKSEQDILSLINLINKVEKHSLSNSESTHKLEFLLNELKIDLNNVKSQFIELDNKIDVLEQSNKQLVLNSAKLKEEIIFEASEEIKKFKESQNNLINRLNEQMSNLEKILNENQSRLLDKGYVDQLIISHFQNFKENVKDEINVTLWKNFTNHVNNLFKSTDLKTEKFKSSNLFSTNSEKSCNCISSNFRYSSSLNCVRIHQVRQLLKDALNLFSADKIGMADFALESAGGTIVTAQCSETYTDRASTLTVFGIPLMRLTNSPRTIIQPNLNPGECWPMKGSRGRMVVQLSAVIEITAVSIDHIPKSISPNESIESAVQNFEIKAYNETDKVGKSLGNFTYLDDSNPVQTFYIQNPYKAKFVEMIVNSNYGNPEYTCIYRLRVHGKLIQL